GPDPRNFNQRVSLGRNDLLIRTFPKETSLIGQQNAVELIPILRKAWEQYQDDDGWANVSSTGSFVKRSKPDFDPRSYGATKLPEIIQNLSSDFEMKKYKGKGTVNIIAYRPVTI
ncbi:OST-HTH/LOTUS domain-containing protein, partial [Klebsiella pneumoniae]